MILPVLGFAGRRSRHDTDGAARMHEGVIRAAHFNQRHNLRAAKRLFGGWAMTV